MSILSPSEIAEIRARSEAYDADDGVASARSVMDPDGFKAHMDRASLLAHIDRLPTKDKPDE